MLLVQQPPCLTTRPRLLVSSVRSVQSGAGIHKSRLFSIMVVKLHLPFVLHLSERSMENRVNKENYLILGEINLKKKIEFRGNCAKYMFVSKGNSDEKELGHCGKKTHIKDLF